MKNNFKNILFYIFIIVIISISIVINNDYRVINNRAVISTNSSFNKYKDYKFVTLNLSNAKETRFSISDNDKLSSTIYLVNYKNKDILIELSSSTIITNRVNVMYNKDNENILLLKEDLNKETEEKLNFKSGYYTNINLKENEDIIKVKYYISLGIICLCLLFVIVNFIKIIIKK